MRKRHQQGDTIIEVMLAFTVFAMLAVGAITIMNQGVASAQEALETTLVREEIDGQAETLRFLHQSYMADSNSTLGKVFQKVRTDHTTEGLNPTEFGDAQCLTSIPQGAGAKPSFALSPKTGAILTDLKPMGADIATVPAYAKIQYSLDGTPEVPYGIWIEAIDGGAAAGQPAFTDFHVRACWYSVTSDVPRTLGTIVRLYVPA